MKKHNLGPQSIEIVAQVMATDSTLAFDPNGKVKSAIELAGSDMTRKAAKEGKKKRTVERWIGFDFT